VRYELHFYIAFRRNSVFKGLGLNKTTQKHGCCKKVVQEEIESDVLKQIYFNVNDENAITLECFNLRTNAV
jgi:hypothetical protein